MVDRVTKLLLLAIALGLWMIVVGQWVRPVPVGAMQDVSTDITNIKVNVASISAGVCLNKKIC